MSLRNSVSIEPGELHLTCGSDIAIDRQCAPVGLRDYRDTTGPKYPTKLRQHADRC